MQAGVGPVEWFTGLSMRLQGSMPGDFILNTDNDFPIAEDYEIKAVPVVLLFKNGEKQESVVGTMPKDFYIAAIERVHHWNLP